MVKKIDSKSKYFSPTQYRNLNVRVPKTFKNSFSGLFNFLGVWYSGFGILGGRVIL